MTNFKFFSCYRLLLTQRTRKSCGSYEFLSFKILNHPRKCPIMQGLLQYGPITELIFWKSYLETKSSKVLVISFEHLQKLCIFAKFGRHSSKIEPATPISISKCFGRKFKFERTKSLQILSKVVSYCDLQLVKIWCWYLKPLLINSKITNFALTF